MGRYYFDKENRFIINNYHKAKPFSSFLPGIAGEKGIPIWAFYVNRGQGISSFGVKDKNHPIMEFYPANSAYQYVSTYGFRTFIKVMDKNENRVIEPFNQTPDRSSRKMGIEKDSFFIEENMVEEELSIKVTYSTLVNLPFGGLVRRVEIINFSDKEKNIEIIDGMPALLPYGVENNVYKEMSNLMRSWMEVRETNKKIPYYKLRSSTKDESVISEINEGYFYMNESINDDSVYTIYDPAIVFDYRTDLQEPVGFLHTNYIELMNRKQVYANKVPSAFQLKKVVIQPNETECMDSIIGFCQSYEEIEKFGKKTKLRNLVTTQLKEAKNGIDKLCNCVEMNTGNSVFDQYIRQSYLDNVLRGGKPLIFSGKDKNQVYHIFSRKHGDQERDYNFFSLEPSYYSQGNGSYRDMNQNRRNDLLFEPEVFDFNIWMFYSLIQADGYNPLSIKGTKFLVKPKDRKELMEEVNKNFVLAKDDLTDSILAGIEYPFTPGSLATAIQSTGVEDKKIQSILELVLSYASQEIDVDFEEGFWSDHFTYNQDLIDSFKYMYPDKMEELLLHRKDYGFYNAPYYVLPRHKKYGMTSERRIRQYKVLDKKKNDIHDWLIDENGKKVQTNLFNKILVLCLTKFMNLDPFGMGIEMEGDKPGWNDALNGLPGIFGSGMSETVELKRCITFLKSELKVIGLKTSEILVLGVIYKLAKDIYKIADSRDNFVFWDQLNRIKEEYRNKTMYQISSQESSVELNEIVHILDMVELKLEEGIKRALAFGNGVLPSYFIMDVTEFEVLKNKTNIGLQAVKPLKFEAKALPNFLEAPARYLKTLDTKAANKLYEKIKETDIFDKELSMYKTSESLEGETMEIGRIRAFTPGWLERESVFLHMTYKYLLSLLKAGLYDSFYKDIKTNLVPYMDPAIYGRPITENSSFIASSVNPDENVIGQGFFARLSGSTAEVLSMWLYMFVGKKGFSMYKDQLIFTFEPILKGDLFDSEGEISFKLFGTTDVTYINSNKKDTFGKDKGMISEIIIDGERYHKTYLEEDRAKALRDKKIKHIKIVFE